MTIAIAISAFFGLVAAISLLSCHASIRYALVRWCEIRHELAAIDRATIAAPRPIRRPQEAFTLLAA
ncbi:MAG: hypothetical protein WA957_10205 [Alteraurantiacibacter sp.]